MNSINNKIVIINKSYNILRHYSFENVEHKVGRIQIQLYAAIYSYTAIDIDTRYMYMVIYRYPMLDIYR